jgi:uroporphyrinogen-III synthase
VKNTLAVTPPGALDGVRVASIGPATSKVIRAHGLRVDVEAKVSNVDGLVEAIVTAGTE